MGVLKRSFSPEKALAVIEKYNTEEKRTIVLSAPASAAFSEGTLPEKIGDKVDPATAEQDLFRMRAIQVLKDKVGLPPKEVLGLTHNRSKLTISTAGQFVLNKTTPHFLARLFMSL